VNINSSVHNERKEYLIKCEGHWHKRKT